MDHLKSSSELWKDIDFDNNILPDLKDICLELKDNGKFNYIISNPKYSFNSKYSNILIHKAYRSYQTGGGYYPQIGGGYYPGGYDDFSYQEIAEVVERIKDFMKSHGFNTSVYTSKVRMCYFNACTKTPYWIPYDPKTMSDEYQTFLLCFSEI